MLALHAERISRPWTLGELVNSTVARLTSGTAAASVWLAEARCGLVGHAMMMRLEPGRMALQCMSCGRQTPGWTLRRGTETSRIRERFAVPVANERNERRPL